MCRGCTKRQNDELSSKTYQHQHSCNCQCCCNNALALKDHKLPSQTYYHCEQKPANFCDNSVKRRCRGPGEHTLEEVYNFVEDKPVDRNSYGFPRAAKSQTRNEGKPDDHGEYHDDDGKLWYTTRKCEGLEWSSAKCELYGVREQGWKCSRCFNLGTITDDVAQMASASSGVPQVRTEASTCKGNSEKCHETQQNEKNRSPEKLAVRVNHESVLPAYGNENLKAKNLEKQMLLVELSEKTDEAKKDDCKGQFPCVTRESAFRPPAKTVGCSDKNVRSNDAEKQHGDIYPKLSEVENVSDEELLASGAWESSMVFQHCAFPKCINFASKYTKPFCHEHSPVESEEKFVSPAIALLNFAILGELCQVTGCRRMTSPTVHPYCYEHFDDHQSDVIRHSSRRTRAAIGCENRAKQKDASTMTDAAPPQSTPQPHNSEITPTPVEYIPSMVSIQCIHPACSNYVSVYTRPVCYEHLGYTTPPSAPYYNDTLETDSSLPSLIARWPASTPAHKNFIAVMHELEKRCNGPVAKCLTPSCPNSGNARCKGRCNRCLRQLQL